MDIQRNENARHVAVAEVVIKVYEQLPDGQLSGDVVFTKLAVKELAGSNKDKCLEGVESWLKTTV